MNIARCWVRRTPKRTRWWSKAKRELLPVEYEEPIPTWPLGPLWWGLKNPTQSWRIFLPDLNRPEDGPPDVGAAAYLPLGPVNGVPDRAVPGSWTSSHSHSPGTHSSDAR